MLVFQNVVLHSNIFVCLHLEYTPMFPVLDHSACDVCVGVLCASTRGCGTVGILSYECEVDCVLRPSRTNLILGGKTRGERSGNIDWRHGVCIHNSHQAPFGD